METTFVLLVKFKAGTSATAGVPKSWKVWESKFKRQQGDKIKFEGEAWTVVFSSKHKSACQAMQVKFEEAVKDAGYKFTRKTSKF